MRYPNRAAGNLYHAAIAALTVGSIMKGVMDIYGTTNILIRLYWIAGIIFLAASILVYCIYSETGRRQS